MTGTPAARAFARDELIRAMTAWASKGGGLVANRPFWTSITSTAARAAESFSMNHNPLGINCAQARVFPAFAWRALRPDQGPEHREILNVFGQVFRFRCLQAAGHFPKTRVIDNVTERGPADEPFPDVGVAIHS